VRGEGGGRGDSGVEGEGGERASGISLPAHAIEIEVGEGTVESRSSRDKSTRAPGWPRQRRTRAPGARGGARRASSSRLLRGRRWREWKARAPQRGGGERDRILCAQFVSYLLIKGEEGRDARARDTQQLRSQAHRAARAGRTSRGTSRRLCKS
jgi:hypothetical protein